MTGPRVSFTSSPIVMMTTGTAEMERAWRRQLAEPYRSLIPSEPKHDIGEAMFDIGHHSDGPDIGHYR